MRVQVFLLVASVAFSSCGGDDTDGENGGSSETDRIDETSVPPTVPPTDPPATVPQTLPEPQSLTGILVLTDEDVEGHWDSCYGTGGYDDIQPGMNVQIRDGDGSIIATASTENLDESDEADERFTLAAIEARELGTHSHCFLKFEAEVEDTDFYEISIGGRGSLAQSRAELEASEWMVELGIGG